LNKTILILAPQEDEHAFAVATILNSDFGVNTVIWDSRRLPTEDTTSFF
jgi:hypothetical protein